MDLLAHSTHARSASSRSAGFTLIELVVTLLILGVLAAAVIPRFMDSRISAHESSVKAVGGAFATAVQMVHGQWQVNGAVPNADDVQGFGQNDVDVNANGWPTATNGNNSIPAGNAGRNQCSALLRTLLQNGPSVSLLRPEPGLFISSAYAFSGPPHDPAADYWATASANQCTFEYRPVANLSFSYYCLTGTVVIDDDAGS